MSTPTPPPAAPPPAAPPPAAPPPVAAAPPAAPHNIQLHLEVPASSNVGDKLQITTGFGTFNFVVPQGAAAGKKITVTLPAPPTYVVPATGVPILRIQNLSAGPPLDPLYVTLQKEYRAVIDATICRLPALERREVSLSLDLSALRPVRAAQTPKRLGAWTLQKTVHDVEGVAGWGDASRSLAKQSVAFDRHAFEVAVEATPAPWVGVDATSGADASGTDVVLGVTVRRVAATVAGGAPPAAGAAEPAEFILGLEFADRWSELQREVLAIGDVYDFDLGDRKRLADVKKPGVPGQPNSIRVRVHLAVAPRPVAAVVASAKRPRS